MKIEVYTDGACKGNPGMGGWGALILFGEDVPTRISLKGAAKETTNNRMELMAAIRALRVFEDSTSLTLYTDSKYVKDGIEKWLSNWKKKGWRTAGGGEVKNQDLWKALDSLCERHQVQFEWVEGHSGHPLNDRADQLANEAIEVLLRRGT